MKRFSTAHHCSRYTMRCPTPLLLALHGRPCHMYAATSDAAMPMRYARYVHVYVARIWKSFLFFCTARRAHVPSLAAASPLLSLSTLRVMA